MTEKLRTESTPLEEIYAIGLDVGGTNLKGGLVDGTGQLRLALSEATPRSVDGFQKVAESFFARLSPNVTIRAIGIGCKGVVDTKTTLLVRSPGDLKHLEGHSLRELVRAGAAGKSVFADNDARTALIAEWLWGAAKGCQNVLMMTLGTGVGGGMLMQGQIMRGAHGVAGHVGHMTIDPHGPMCICGNYGCLETVFSARAIEAEAFSAAHRRVNSALTDRGHASDCSQVFQDAAESDEAARWIINRATQHLGAAIASLVHLVDPELIILGGQMAEAGPQLLDPLRLELRSRTRFLIGRDIPIVFPRVPSHAGVIGAAGLALLETGALRG
ncbi:MAG: ROK family protein [Candidatus Acidiferrales bacterium]